MNLKTPEYRAACRQEFIGRDTTVTASPHPGYVGLSGKVVNETMRTLHVLTDSGVKMIPKSASTFHLLGYEINGQHIMFRPEDRIKKIR